MSGEQSVRLRFVKGELGAEALEAEIASILEDLANPASDASRSAIASGLDPADMTKARASVEQEGKGFGVVAIAILIAAPVAAHIVNQFWDDVIWPEIKKRLGRDALGKRKDKE